MHGMVLIAGQKPRHWMTYWAAPPGVYPPAYEGIEHILSRYWNVFCHMKETHNRKAQWELISDRASSLPAALSRVFTKVNERQSVYNEEWDFPLLTHPHVWDVSNLSVSSAAQFWLAKAASASEPEQLWDVLQAYRKMSSTLDFLSEVAGELEGRLSGWEPPES